MEKVFCLFPHIKGELCPINQSYFSCEIENFKYINELRKMCNPNPEKRIASFFEINKTIMSNQATAVELYLKKIASVV